MALSYEYSIGSVRAKEKNLFTRQDTERMLECKSEKELLMFLRDKNYGEGDTIEEILDDNSEKSWEYIKSIIPNEKLFDCFFYQNDVHNIKSIIKGTLAQAHYSELIMRPVTIEVKLIEEAVNAGKFSELPDWVSGAAEKAYSVVAHTNDARLADAYLDSACMRAMIDVSQSMDNDFLKEYIKEYVFYCNVKIALRAARTNASEEYYRTALTKLDGMDENSVRECALRGERALVEYLSLKSDYGCDKAMKAFAESPPEFEKFVDDRLMLTARECCKRSGEGADAVIGYFLALRTENEVIHIVASGIRTSAPEETVRKRLRLIYG